MKTTWVLCHDDQTLFADYVGGDRDKTKYAHAIYQVELEDGEAPPDPADLGITHAGMSDVADLVWVEVEVFLVRRVREQVAGRSDPETGEFA